jgi:hypothetical protein
MGQSLEAFRCLDSLIAILAKDAQVGAFLVEFATKISGALPQSLSSTLEASALWGLNFLAPLRLVFSIMTYLTEVATEIAAYGS